MSRKRPKRDDDDEYDEDLQLGLALSLSLQDCPVAEDTAQEKTTGDTAQEKTAGDTAQEKTAGDTAEEKTAGNIKDQRTKRVATQQLDDATANDAVQIEYDNDSSRHKRPRRIQKRRPPVTKDESDDDDELFDDSDSSFSASKISQDSESVSLLTDDIEDTGPKPGTWDAIAAELAEDFIEQQLKRVREAASVPTLPPSAPLDILKESRWTKPPLDSNRWPSTLTTVQVNSLYKSRRDMFLAVAHTAAEYRKREKLINVAFSKKDHITGHDVAAAISWMNLHIRLEDIVVMIKAAKSQFAIDTKKSKVVDVSFIQGLKDRLPLAEWPRDDKTASSSSSQDTRRLPAYDRMLAPKDFDQLISWEEWCVIFDMVRLKVEKNGKVW